MAISPGGRPADASPLGKKGGPRGLSDYTREIAHALMRRGVPKSRAIAIARASEAKRFSHSKNPAIASAAVAAVAQDHVLDHRKRGHSLSVPAFDQIGVGGGVGANPLFGTQVDLNWAEYDQNRPKTGTQPAAAPPPAAPAASAAPPDLYSPQTHQNISNFQKAHGLPVTGQLDPKTVAWLNDPANSTAARAASASAAKKAAAAAKKAAAAQTMAAKQAAAAAKRAAAAHTAELKAQDRKAAQDKANAVQNGKMAVAAGKAGNVRTVSMSVPIVGSNDGARMTVETLRKVKLEKLRRIREARRK